MVDASPCIGLARIGELRLLPEVFKRVLIAESVVGELWNRNRDDGAWEIVRYENVEVHKGHGLGFGRVPSTLSKADRDTIGLALARAEVDVVILDDFEAREHARTLGLRIMGAVGVMALAKRRGFLDVVRPCFGKLLEVGFRVNRELLNRVLRELGEPPLEEGPPP